MIKKITFLWMCVFMIQCIVAQEYDQQRIQKLENKLTAISTDVPGLSEKLNITLQQTNLSTFLLGISEVHNLNLDVNPQLSGIQIINNFKDVLVSDALLYVCKTYNVTIDFTGSILYMTPYQKKNDSEKHIIDINYEPTSQYLSIDLKNDNLADAFKLISDTSGKGIFYTPDVANQTISAFIKELPFDIAMEKIAYSNDLIVAKTKDGSFEFESRVLPNGNNTNGQTAITRPIRPRKANFFFKVIDQESKRLEVDIQNVAVADIIYDIGNELQLNVFTASPLDNAGVASVKAKDITFDQLLTKIFENTTLASQNTTNTTANNPTRAGQSTPPTSALDRFTFKIEDGVYYFGTFKQLTLRSAEVIPLRY
ncbi:MAG: hypothetical protein ABJE42_19445, partial [Dokdonia sp.]